MQLSIVYGAVLLALIAILPALDYFNIKPFGDRKTGRFSLWDLVASEIGAVTVTYFERGGVTRINGSTTNPTAQQASQVEKQTAVIVFGVTGDVQALFTHNWGLDASAPTYREPEVLIDLISVTTYWPLLTLDRTNTNVLAINKPATDGPTTIVVTIRRPHSEGQ